MLFFLSEDIRFLYVVLVMDCMVCCVSLMSVVLVVDFVMWVNGLFCFVDVRVFFLFVMIKLIVKCGIRMFVIFLRFFVFFIFMVLFCGYFFDIVIVVF